MYILKVKKIHIGWLKKSENNCSFDRNQLKSYLSMLGIEINKSTLLPRLRGTSTRFLSMKYSSIQLNDAICSKSLFPLLTINRRKCWEMSRNLYLKWHLTVCAF